MKIAITTIYILNCLFLLMVVLLQAGRGGGLAMGGGGGGSATVFGNRGASTFLQKLTVWSAAGFMILSMVLAHMSSQRSAVEEGTFEDPEAIPSVMVPNTADEQTNTMVDETNTVSPEAPAATDEVPTEEAPAATDEAAE